MVLHLCAFPRGCADVELSKIASHNLAPDKSMAWLTLGDVIESVLVDGYRGGKICRMSYIQMDAMCLSVN
jgi:hypothetical protein